MTTEHKVLSDKEVKELASALLPSDGLGGLAHKAGLALLDLLKQQDASSNYFSARMLKANTEIQRLNEGWSEANSQVLDLRMKAVADSDEDRRRILALEEEVKTLKAAAAPKLPGRLAAAGFDTGWYTGRLVK